MDPNENFDPQAMVDWTGALAEKSAEDFTHQEKLNVFRSVVEAFIKNRCIDCESLEDVTSGESFEIVSQTLYMCHLVLKTFPSSYAEVDANLNKTETTRKDNIDSLKRAFDL